MIRNLAGKFKLQAGWLEPQFVDVMQHGNIYIFQFLDKFGRRLVFESQAIGFDVTVFIQRKNCLSRFIVQGDWRQIVYRDNSGADFPALMIRQETVKASKHGTPEQT